MGEPKHDDQDVATRDMTANDAYETELPKASTSLSAAQAGDTNAAAYREASEFRLPPMQFDPRHSQEMATALNEQADRYQRSRNPRGIPGVGTDNGPYKNMSAQAHGYTQDAELLKESNAAYSELVPQSAFAMESVTRFKGIQEALGSGFSDSRLMNADSLAKNVGDRKPEMVAALSAGDIKTTQGLVSDAAERFTVAQTGLYATMSELRSFEIGQAMSELQAKLADENENKAAVNEAIESASSLTEFLGHALGFGEDASVGPMKLSPERETPAPTDVKFDPTPTPAAAEHKKLGYEQDAPKPTTDVAGHKNLGYVPEAAPAPAPVKHTKDGHAPEPSAAPKQHAAAAEHAEHGGHTQHLQAGKGERIERTEGILDSATGINEAGGMVLGAVMHILHDGELADIQTKIDRLSTLLSQLKADQTAAAIAAMATKFREKKQNYVQAARAYEHAISSRRTAYAKAGKTADTLHAKGTIKPGDDKASQTMLITSAARETDVVLRTALPAGQHAEEVLRKTLKNLEHRSDGYLVNDWKQGTPEGGNTPDRQQVFQAFGLTLKWNEATEKEQSAFDAIEGASATMLTTTAEAAGDY